MSGPHEAGQLPEQGKRNDYHALVAAIRAQEFTTIDEIYDSEYCGLAFRYERALRGLLLRSAPRRCEPVDVRIYWGRTGTGKSRRAWAEFPDAYSKPDGKWWDGYERQASVIWDDFDWEAPGITLALMLKWLDRYPTKAEVKGDFSNLAFKVIVFTSNTDPKEWWLSDHPDRKEAFFRRVTCIEEIK